MRALTTLLVGVLASTLGVLHAGAAGAAAPAPRAAVHGQAGESVGADDTLVGLVVDTGDEVKTRCVAFSGESITAVDLLRRADVGVVTAQFSLGEAVCALCGVGCPADNCFCDGDAYWNSSTSTGDGSWQRAATGASSRRLTEGDVDGWAWGADGARPSSSAPFRTICAAHLAARERAREQAASPAEPSSEPTTGEPSTAEPSGPATTSPSTSPTSSSPTPTSPAPTSPTPTSPSPTSPTPSTPATTSPAPIDPATTSPAPTATSTASPTATAQPDPAAGRGDPVAAGDRAGSGDTDPAATSAPADGDGQASTSDDKPTATGSPAIDADPSRDTAAEEGAAVAAAAGSADGGGGGGAVVLVVTLAVIGGAAVLARRRTRPT